jgi:hypothetical protein
LRNNFAFVTGSNRRDYSQLKSQTSIIILFFYILSITIADAPPPPLQIAAAPVLALFCSIHLGVTMILAPEAS